MTPVADYLRQLGAKIDALDFAPVLRQARAELTASTAASFTEAKTPDGVPWPPRKHSYPHPPLRKSGDLFDSALAAVAGAQLEPRQLMIDSAGLVPYGNFQRLGTATIDAREFLGVPDDVYDRTQERAAEFAFEKLEG